MKTWTGFVQGKYQYKGGNEGMQRAEKQDSDTRGMRIGAGTEKSVRQVPIQGWVLIEGYG